MKKICVVIGSRANYSSIKSAMLAISNHRDLQLQLIVAASAILDRYGSVVTLIENDGFVPDARVHMIIEGESPLTMAKSTGLGLIELPSLFDQLKPDVVLTVGDRYETMATTLAAAYMNIVVAHTMGGEISGTIDESIRHAITKFAHIHFPACEGARKRIVQLGEEARHVHAVGCPRIDLVDEILKSPDPEIGDTLFDTGVGHSIDLKQPFVLVSQHPVTTEFGAGEQQIAATLGAIKELNLPAIVLWPNSDAGSGDIAHWIRKLRESKRAHQMHFFKNLPINVYINLMLRTTCLVGNSSSGIREGAFMGTPVVNIGSRQNGRDRGANVIDVDHDQEQIKMAIEKQIIHGRYEMDSIYGDGRSGARIAEILANERVAIQKRITY